MRIKKCAAACLLLVLAGCSSAQRVKGGSTSATRTDHIVTSPARQDKSKIRIWIIPKGVEVQSFDALPPLSDGVKVDPQDGGDL